jgi:hypothetical protein
MSCSSLILNYSIMNMLSLFPNSDRQIRAPVTGPSPSTLITIALTMEKLNAGLGLLGIIPDF